MTITKNIKHNGTLDELVEAANTLMPRFRRHHFNMKIQQAYCANLRSNLQDIECMVHVDYAENYLGKSTRKVQAAHFNASHGKITLHTGVFSY